MATTLTSKQIEFYHQQGYLHAPSVIPADLLRLMQRVLDHWANQTIDRWLSEGLIDDTRTNLGFQDRLYHLWQLADKPRYMRSPRRDLVSQEMFQILTHPTLLDLAQDLLDTTEVSVHGIFNARPKLPDQLWTQTPWHQDAQYYRDAENIHVVSIWIPLQSVTEENSCLQVAPKRHRDELHEGYDDPVTGFRGLAPEIRDALPGVSIEMAAGDALCFTQLTPHRALPNRSDQVRWSMDFRYESTLHPTETGQKQGFIARSEANPNAVISYEDWLKQWDDIPLGNY